MFGTVFVLDVHDRAPAHAIRQEREKERKRKTEIERQREKETKGERQKHTRRYITERKDEKDRGSKKLSTLCLGTGHLRRETLHKLFARRRRFSLGLDDFLRVMGIKGDT